MLTLHVLCGLPGSGKTTHASLLLHQTGAQIHHYDDFKKQFKNLSGSQIHECFFAEIVLNLRKGLSVIVDDLHTTQNGRNKLLQVVKNIDCAKVLYVIDTPYELCVERDAHRKHCVGLSVIQHIRDTYLPPSYNEGGDDIVFIREEVSDAE